MKSFYPILLRIWDRASRHSENLDAALGTISNLLAEHLPLHVMHCYRYHRDNDQIEPLFAVRCGHGQSKPIDTGLHRAATPTLQLELRNKTSRTMEIASVLADAPAGAQLLTLLVFPVNYNPYIIVLESIPNKPFSERHQAMANAICSPLEVVLTNYERMHEMQTLREAANATSQSLLRKLGRNEVMDEIIGRNGGLKNVMDRVDRVADSFAPVLLLGETGTGKEVIARLIHLSSDRRDKPFIRVNCGAIPHDLIDAQLFGHEKGAFTGASRQHAGYFERADTGTLFLDEIGELSPAAQVRLLRILQDGWLERVGGSAPIHVNVRILAATHQNLTEMVQQGTFREDLWYRIAVFPVLLPALRDRTEDIPDLARHFARRASIRFGLPERFPSDDDTRLLCNYTWPGNIRELASVIDRAALLGDTTRLAVPEALGIPHTQTPTIEPAEADSYSAGSLCSLDEAMKQHIERALRRAEGRIDGPFGAARMLNINPHTLRGRMRKLDIDWRAYKQK